MIIKAGKEYNDKDILGKLLYIINNPRNCVWNSIDEIDINGVTYEVHISEHYDTVYLYFFDDNEMPFWVRGTLKEGVFELDTHGVTDEITYETIRKYVNGM